MTVVRYPVALIITFIWIGFVCAISFMEAWIKFRAPGVTLPIGLGIGRLVFNALNKVEWVFAFVIIANLLISKGPIFSLNHLFYLIPVVLLVIQTFGLLPALDARATLEIKEQSVISSNLHFYYVGMELLKSISLIIFGVSQFKITTI